mgnify:CR=1 FL=1
MTMTRQQFQLIADTLRGSDLGDQQLERLAREFARTLARTNPRFDGPRFVEAATRSES